MNRDFAEMLSALSEAGAEFLIVGAHALAAHGTPRATGDLDIWVRPTPSKSRRVMQALTVFGAPLHDLTLDDLTRPDTVFQICVPPSRVDILTGISGVQFDDAWPKRVALDLDGAAVSVIGREDFILNTRATGRPREARATGRTEPPNILAIYDVGVLDDTLYLVEELLDGTTLREALAHGAFPPRKAVSTCIAMPLCWTSPLHLSGR
ncbi:MAG: hypothetical protein ACKOEC_01370 [Acidimicrobiia bacterium]